MAVAEAERNPAPLGFLDQVRSLNRPFWFANFMELFERWAYYGVRAVLSLYIVDAVANGGLQFTHIQKGTIYAWWALIQSLLPMFTGGFADRYGYKKSIAISLAISISGYLLMASQHSFPGFFLGCMLLATGTAVFKPGVQGTLVSSTNERNSSIGWGFFYQIVNIGGFLGPAVTGLIRPHGWNYVFIASAVCLALNYLLLFCYQDIPVEPQEKKGFLEGIEEFFNVIWVSVKNVFEPRLISFLVIFSGFWLMFMQLFDLLPNFIDDWVNSSHVARDLGLNQLGILLHLPWLAHLGGQNIPPEWMINLDSGSIVLLMLPIAWLCSRLKPIVSMMIGMTISAIGLVIAGFSMNGTLCLAGILVFAIGEMASSPKMNEYLGLIAPPGKKGLYMGYANVPLAIGWGIGSKLGGFFYENFADKVNLAKQMMLNNHLLTPDQIGQLPKEKVLETLATLKQQTVPQATQMLWNVYHPAQIWLWFSMIGMASVAGMLVYHFVIERAKRLESAPAA